MEDDSPPFTETRFALIDPPIKDERASDSPHPLSQSLYAQSPSKADSVSSPPRPPASQQPIPSTETADISMTEAGPLSAAGTPTTNFPTPMPASTATPAPAPSAGASSAGPASSPGPGHALPTKKKGTATAVKKPAKKPQNGPANGVKGARGGRAARGSRGGRTAKGSGRGGRGTAKTPKTERSDDGLVKSEGDEDDMDEDDELAGEPESEGEGIEELEESDHGPYCICRGPDDHRWMICCENCEDWFHGQCINLDKSIGESLIEKFICPLCTNGSLTSLYKKTCTLPSCRKPARLAKKPVGSEGFGDGDSVFCSNEHAQVWWERLIAKLPKGKGAGAGAAGAKDDAMAQTEFVALLKSGLAGFDEDGMWRLARDPYAKDSRTLVNGNGEHGDLESLGEEEKSILQHLATERAELEAESSLCQKMLILIDLAQDRRRAAINADLIGEDICGYDQRLDTISARDAFAAFLDTDDGKLIFEKSQLGDPEGDEEELVRGMCEKKRCKTHHGWSKMLTLGLRHQIKEMGEQEEEVAGEERRVRWAAAERGRRKLAEKNWVEVL